MMLELADIPVAAGPHAVKFYDEDAELAQAVAAYVADAAAVGAVAVVIATEASIR